MSARFSGIPLLMLAGTGPLLGLAGCSVPRSMIQDDRSMQDAAPAAIADAQAFSAHDEYANVYITHAGLDSVHIDIDVDDKSLGALAQDDVMRLHLAPGRYRIRNYSVLLGDDVYLNALFDLEVAAGSVVLLECHPWLTKGILAAIPQDPVLQEWRHCSNDELTDRDGIKACLKVYANRKITKAPKGFGKTIPASACYLSTNRERFRTARLVDSKHPFITNEGYEFSMAIEQGSIDRLRQFVAAYPRSARVHDVRTKIRELEAQQERDRFARSVQETLARDEALPLDARKDKYLIALTDYLREENFEQALVYFEALDELHIEISPTFDFLWGDTLLKARQPAEAGERLRRYVVQAGSSGAYYGAALQLINQTEQQ